MNSLVKSVVHNFWYKLSAIILATMFWYIVQGEEVLEINRKIQIHLRVPDGYLVKGSLTPSKDATLSGSRALLGDFSSRPLNAYITIPPGKTGKLRFRIDKDYFPNWNPRIKLTVHDAYLNVVVDEKLTRTLTIQEHLQGLPADGYIIEKTVIEPNRVEVTGLKSELSRVKHILTEPIDVSDLQKSKSITANLQTRDFEGAIFSLEQVTVHVQVGEKKINKRFGSIPIEIEGGNDPDQVVLRPNFVSIVIQGTPGVLSFIKRGDLRAFLDIRDLSPGRYERKVQVKIPPDTVLIETFPENAIIEITQHRR